MTMAERVLPEAEREFKNLIDGEWRASRARRSMRRPVHRRAVGARAQRRRRRTSTGGAGRATRVRSEGPRRLRPSSAAPCSGGWPSDRGEAEPLTTGRSTRTASSSARSAARRGRLADGLQLLRGPGEMPHGMTRWRSASRTWRLHGPRADRRCRGDHAVEQPARAADLEAVRPRWRPGTPWSSSPRRSPRRPRSSSRELIEEAGFPSGVVNVVTGAGAGGRGPRRAPRASTKISFTGSTAVGKQIAHAAAEPGWPRLARARGQVPEHRLPGRRPRQRGQRRDGGRLRRHRADLQGRLPRAGRRGALRRVHQGRGRARGRKIRLGDPRIPRASWARRGAAQHEKVLRYLDSRREGATLATGGGARDPALAKGLFVEPTVSRRHQRHADCPRGGLRPRRLSVSASRTRTTPSGSPTTRPYGLAAGVWTETTSGARTG